MAVYLASMTFDAPSYNWLISSFPCLVALSICLLERIRREWTRKGVIFGLTAFIVLPSILLYHTDRRPFLLYLTVGLALCHLTLRLFQWLVDAVEDFWRMDGNSERIG